MRTGLRAAAELVAALRLLRLTPTALLLAAACRCAAALTAAQHLHGAAHVHHHFGGVFVLTGLIGPLAGTQLAFNVHLRAFTQILTSDFRQL